MMEWIDDGDSEDLIFKINNKGSESIIYTADNNQVTFLCDPSRFDLWRSILRFRYFALGEKCTSISWIDYYFKYYDGKHRLVPYESQPEFKDTFPNITVHLRPPDLQQTTLRLQKEIHSKIQNLVIHMYPTTSNFLIQGGACNKWVVYEFMILCKAVDCLERGVASAHLNINFRALPTLNPTESCLSKLELLEKDTDIETIPNVSHQAIDKGHVSCLDDMADSSFENELELSYYNIVTEPNIISDATLNDTTDFSKSNYHVDLEEVNVPEQNTIVKSLPCAEIIDLIDLSSETTTTNCMNTEITQLNLDCKPKDLTTNLQAENTELNILSCGTSSSRSDEQGTCDNALNNNIKNTIPELPKSPRVNSQMYKHVHFDYKREQSSKREQKQEVCREQGMEPENYAQTNRNLVDLEYIECKIMDKKDRKNSREHNGKANKSVQTRITDIQPKTHSIDCQTMMIEIDSITADSEKYTKNERETLNEVINKHEYNVTNSKDKEFETRINEFDMCTKDKTYVKQAMNEERKTTDKSADTGNAHLNCCKEILTLKQMIFNLQLQLCELSDTCTSMNTKLTTITNVHQIAESDVNNSKDNHKVEQTAKHNHSTSKPKSSLQNYDKVSHLSNVSQVNVEVMKKDCKIASKLMEKKSSTYADIVARSGPISTKSSTYADVTASSGPILTNTKKPNDQYPKETYPDVTASSGPISTNTKNSNDPLIKSQQNIKDTALPVPSQTLNIDSKTSTDDTDDTSYNEQCFHEKQLLMKKTSTDYTDDSRNEHHTPSISSPLSTYQEDSDDEDFDLSSIVFRKKSTDSKASRKDTRPKRYLNLPSNCANLLIGDSNLKNVNRRQLDPSGRTHIRTYRGCHIDSLTKIIDNSEFDYPYIEKVSILVGTNDCQQTTIDMEDILHKYEILIKTSKSVFPNAIISINAIPPQGKAKVNKRISYLNKKIANLCRNNHAKFSTCESLWVHHVDETGQIDKGLILPDDIHFHSIGLGLFLKSIKTFFQLGGLHRNRPYRNSIHRDTFYNKDAMYGHWGHEKINNSHYFSEVTKLNLN